jgi:hypothetical protein
VAFAEPVGERDDGPGALATSKMILRGTLPLSTVPSGAGDAVSGMGDFHVRHVPPTSSESKTRFGVGPLVVVPTATDNQLGTGKQQAGGAVVVVSNVSPTGPEFGIEFFHF